MEQPRIALTTYSVKPRGGVVHTLELAEALQAEGVDVTVVAMGDPEVGFFRPVDVPVRIVQAPKWGDTLEERVFRWIGAMTDSMAAMHGDFDIVHSQDCISARAAAKVRDEGGTFRLVRTVHHVDDFTTQALMDCQRHAILEPDRILVVSQLWKKLLAQDYGVTADIVLNGVRLDRFSTPITDDRRSELRRGAGLDDRFIFLTVGGIEPRKGSVYLVDALGRLVRENPDRKPAVAVIGGHSFQDYRQYRESVLNGLEAQGIELDRDLVLLGTLDDQDLRDWFHAADAFAFPSIKEGWGLVVLEAMAAGLPVVTSDIEVFHEFLTHDGNAVMTGAADVDELAAGMQRLIDEPALRSALAHAGPRTAAKYSWPATARAHLSVYRQESAALLRTDQP